MEPTALRLILRRIRHDLSCTVASVSGLARLIELTRPEDGATVLMYHSVPSEDVESFIAPGNKITPSQFEAQIRFLAQHRNVVSMDTLLECHRTGKNLPPNSVCLTFDDGYIDNLTVVAPLLKRYDLPAVLYLATGYVSRQESQWADVLHWLFTYRTVSTLKFPEPSIYPIDLRIRADASRAYRDLHKRLLRSLHPERTELIQVLTELLRPKVRMPRLTLNWQEVNEMRRQFPGFTIGGHTKDHIDLSSHHRSVVVHQIEECSKDILRFTGDAPRHFSFPYSRWSKESREAVIESGWISAVGDGPGAKANRRSDPYLIPRIDAPESWLQFKLKTGAAFPRAVRVLGLG